MKTLLILAMLLIPGTLRAETNLQKYWREFYPGQKCVDAQMFGFYITRNLGQNLYEMHTLRSRGARNAILKMNTRGFAKPGEVIGVKVKWVNTHEMPTQDGFDATYDLLEECV